MTVMFPIRKTLNLDAIPESGYIAMSLIRTRRSSDLREDETVYKLTCRAPAVIARR